MAAAVSARGGRARAQPRTWPGYLPDLAGKA